MTPQLSGPDYIAIRVMRELDRANPVSDVAIDFEAVENANRDTDGTFAHPGQVLAKRAHLSMQKRMGTDWETTFQLAWDWIAGRMVSWILVGAALAGVIVSLAGSSIILTPPDARKISISTVVPLLMGSLAFLVFPLIAQFGVETPLVLFRDLLAWIWRQVLHGRVTGPAARDMATPQLRVLPILLTILNRPIGLLGVLCSHACWIAGYLTIVASLAVRMGVQEYDFTWQATFTTGVRQWLLEPFLPSGADSDGVIAYLSFGENEPHLPQQIWERHREDSQVLREFNQLPLAGIRRAANLKQLEGKSEVADVSASVQEDLDDSRRATFFKQLNTLSNILKESLGHLRTSRQQIDAANLTEKTKQEAMCLQEEIATLVGKVDGLLHTSAGPEADLALAGASILTSANAIVNRAAILRQDILADIKKTATNDFLERSRHDVAVAILRILFVVCVAPRVVLFLIGGVQFFWTRRSLQPNLQDDYHTALMAFPLDWSQ